MPLVEAPPAMRPPLKWAGGKRWQVPHLLPLWKPPCRTPAGRTVRRRAGRHARPVAGSRAAERRESASGQLLPLAEAGSHDRSQDGEQREAVLPSPRPLQRARHARAERTRPKPRRSSTTSIGPATTACAGSTAKAGSTFRSAATNASATRTISPPTATSSTIGISAPGISRR